MGRLEEDLHALIDVLTEFGELAPVQPLGVALVTTGANHLRSLPASGRKSTAKAEEFAQEGRISVGDRESIGQ